MTFSFETNYNAIQNHAGGFGIGVGVGVGVATPLGNFAFGDGQSNIDIKQSPDVPSNRHFSPIGS